MSPKNRQKRIESASDKLIRWIGSPSSLVLHTVFFIVMLSLAVSGVNFDQVMLVLTTIVSLEAIYLSIFIQMTVNRQGKELEEVAEDLEEVSEDIEEIQEDVEEIQKDVDEIQTDVDEIQENVDEIQEDVEEIEEASAEEQKEEAQQKEIFAKIENSLRDLMQEISDLKAKK
ncbi:DNA recombination protein RmuC [Candidatus Nomurabacteria bacterium]|nr:DNA recombination protein RmuC [Candidatus Nomurabacteria bacterium]